MYDFNVQLQCINEKIEWFFLEELDIIGLEFRDESMVIRYCICICEEVMLCIGLLVDCE